MKDFKDHYDEAYDLGYREACFTFLRIIKELSEDSAFIRISDVTDEVSGLLARSGEYDASVLW